MLPHLEGLRLKHELKIQVDLLIVLNGSCSNRNVYEQSLGRIICLNIHCLQNPSQIESKFLFIVIDDSAISGFLMPRKQDLD